MADAPKILGTDSLRQAYPKLNKSIDNSNEALNKSTTAETNSTAAVNTANAAETKADSVQEQFNQVVIEGDSSVEAAQARVEEDGTVNDTLKDRLDKKEKKFTTQLAENTKKLTWITPEDFGAKGDGITNDSQAFRSAFATKKPIELKDGAKYLINSHIPIYDQDVYLMSKGKATIINNSGETLFNFLNNPKVTTSITGTVLNSSMYKITLPDASNVKAGDLLQIQSNAPWYYDPRPDGNGGYSTYKGELHLVKSVSGNVVTLDTYFYDTYAASETLTIYVTEQRRINMKNIDFELPTSQYSVMMYLSKCFHPTFENIHIRNSQRAGIIIYESYAPQATNCFVDCNIEDLSFIKTGYGIQEYGCVHGKYHHNHFVNCRRGIDISGEIPSRNGICDSNTFVSLGKSYVNVPGITGFGTHGGAEGIIFSNNIIDGAESAIKIRGNSCLVEGNTALNITNEFAYLEFGGEVSVIGNQVISNDQGKGTVSDIPNYLITLSNTKDGQRVSVKDNVATIKEHMIYHYSPATLNMEINATGNDINTGVDKKVLFVSGIPSGQMFTLKNSTILDNQINPDTKFKYNNDNLLVDWATCDIQDYVMPSTSYIVGYGTGTMSSVGYYLMVTKRGKVVKVNGEFKFTVNTSPIRPHIIGLPNPNGAQHLNYIVVDGLYGKHIVQKIRNTDVLYISGTDTLNTDTFAVGTTNIIIFDFAYHMS